MAAGSSGRNPGAPNSVAGRPKPDISDKTRGVGNIAPQPGTSQIPQEIGADAIRLRKFDTGVPFLERSN